MKMSASVKTMFKHRKTFAVRIAEPKAAALPPAVPQMCKPTGGGEGGCPGQQPRGPFQSLKQYIVFSIKQRKHQTHSLKCKNKHNQDHNLIVALAV